MSKNRPDYDHNLETDLPAPLKAKITQYGNAAQEYALKGSQEPDIADMIEEDFKQARYNLERTILTYIEKHKPLKMYAWTSEALAGYTEGQIIVIAENPTQARKKAIEEYKRHAPGHTKERLKQFKADIKPRPSVEQIALIYGSD